MPGSAPVELCFGIVLSVGFIVGKGIRDVFAFDDERTLIIFCFE